MSHQSIAIIGAGPLGLATALALARRGHAPRLFDARPAEADNNDSRILALSHGSRELLELLDAWPAAHATLIHRIQISQQGHFGQTHIDAAEQGLPALGYVLPAKHLAAALLAGVRAAQIPIEYDSSVTDTRASEDFATLVIRNAHGEQRETQAHLIACCEGKIPDAAATRHRDYGQHALLCRATPAIPHHNLAHERFTAQGPIALLPFGCDYAVVWTVPSSNAAALMAAPDADWLTQLQTAIGPHVMLSTIADRASHALGLRMRRDATGTRCVWLGNAAQTLHPVAGQGFNLALRDAWELADILTAAPDPGANALLARYARRRTLDRHSTAHFTDLLVRGFSNDQPLLAGLRGLGLLALDSLPPLRQFIAKRMIYGARGWP
jgi:2-octaprenyl-6-methoxyphenol hydroxylase